MFDDMREKFERFLDQKDEDIIQQKIKEEREIKRNMRKTKKIK